jgi:membrane protease YdiL (CAAX protease family)
MVAVLAVAGNLLQLKNFGVIDMSHQHIKEELQAIAAANPRAMAAVVPPYLDGWVLLLISIVGGVLAGITVNLPFCFGEEFGWRGALAYETRGWGFWKANLFIGVIWGFWHAPLIVQGHNYPGHPIAGVFMMLLFCTGLAYVLGYIRIRAKSVIACAAFHGMINGSAGGLILLSSGGDSLYGVVGVAGGVAGLLLIAIIYLLDRKRIQRYEEILSEPKSPELFYASPETMADRPQ